MSRTIDLTKPLEELNEDDLRYAHDRSLLSLEDTEVVGKWLRERDAARKKGEIPEEVVNDDDETETVPYNPDDDTVAGVNAYLDSLEDDGPGSEERERVLAAERAGQARKGIVGEA